MTPETPTWTDAAGNGPADIIIRKLCNERRNSDIRADDRELRERLNAHIATLTAERDRLLAVLRKIESMSETCLGDTGSHPRPAAGDGGKVDG